MNGASFKRFRFRCECSWNQIRVIGGGAHGKQTLEQKQYLALIATHSELLLRQCHAICRDVLLLVMSLKIGRTGEDWMLATSELAYPLTPRQLATCLTRRTQDLIILPTEKCNFRCTYCYEDFKIGKMAPAIQASLCELITRRVPTLDKLALQWFGGEPLLARDVIFRIASHALKQCDLHGVQLVGSLTTNAHLLTPELFQNLVDLRQNFFQITLDGFGHNHDQVRRLANGKGTFDRIWENLLATRSVRSPFTILLRVHVRKETIEDLPAFIAVLGEHFASDPRYVLDLQHLRNLGGAGGSSVKDPLNRKQVEGLGSEMAALYLSHRQRPKNARASVAPVGGGDQPAPDATPDRYICYASKGNSLLIRADGRIGKCTVALDDDRNTVGRVLPNGELEIDADRVKPWMRGLESGSTQELACPLSRLPQAAA